MGDDYVEGAEQVLREHQRQIDMDGTEVGVSREALDVTLERLTELKAGLAEALKLLRASRFSKRFHGGSWERNEEDWYEQREALIARAALGGGEG